MSKTGLFLVATLIFSAGGAIGAFAVTKVNQSTEHDLIVQHTDTMYQAMLDKRSIQFMANKIANNSAAAKPKSIHENVLSDMSDSINEELMMNGYVVTKK